MNKKTVIMLSLFDQLTLFYSMAQCGFYDFVLVSALLAEKL